MYLQKIMFSRKYKASIKKMFLFLLSISALFLISTSNAHAVSILGFGTQIPDILISKLIWIGFVIFILYISLTLLLLLAGWLFDWVVEAWIMDATEWFNLSVVENAWVAVRDVADSFFIFILLYIGVATIIYGLGQYKKALITVLITAMLVNFSWYFTRLAIDMSNVLAGTIYTELKTDVLSNKNIGWYIFTDVNDWTPNYVDLWNSTMQNVGDPNDAEYNDTKQDGDDAAYLSDQLTSSFNNTDTNQQYQSNTSGSWFSNLFNTVTPTIDDFLGLIVKLFEPIINFLISILFWIFNLGFQFIANLLLYPFLIYILMYIAFMFVSRYIILIFLLVLSPLAFASLALPKARSAVWDKWVGELLGLLIIAPLLMFLLYVSLGVFDAAGGGQVSGGFGNTLFKYLFLIIFLLASISLSKKIASRAAGYAGYLTTTVSSAAVAGSAIAGRKMAGGYLNTVTQKINEGKLQKGGSEDQFARRMGERTFDIRNSGWVSSGLKASGIELRDDFGKTDKGYTSLTLDRLKKEDKNSAEAKRYKELQEKLTQNKLEQELMQQMGSKPSKEDVRKVAEQRSVSGGDNYSEVAKNIRRDIDKEYKEETSIKKNEQKRQEEEFTKGVTTALKTAIQKNDTRTIINTVANMNPKVKTGLDKSIVTNTVVQQNFNKRDLEALIDNGTVKNFNDKEFQDLRKNTMSSKNPYKKENRAFTLTPKGSMFLKGYKSDAS